MKTRIFHYLSPSLLVMILVASGAVYAEEATVSAVITVTEHSGEPLANGAYQIQLYDQEARNIETIREGTLDANGRVELTDLPANDGSRILQLRAGGSQMYLGMLDLPAGTKVRELEFNMPPSVGAKAPDIAMRHVFSDETSQLSEYRGQVVFLEFWATWCGPCQQPMAHNNEILKSKGEAWEGEAAVVAVSIDDDLETVRKHVEDKGWTAVPHFWSEKGGGGFNSEAPNAYGVTGIPTALLIDREGIIQWRGHPGSVSVEDLIADAIGEGSSEDVSAK